MTTQEKPNIQHQIKDFINENKFYFVDENTDSKLIKLEHCLNAYYSEINPELNKIDFSRANIIVAHEMKEKLEEAYRKLDTAKTLQLNTYKITIADKSAIITTCLTELNPKYFRIPTLTDYLSGNHFKQKILLNLSHESDSLISTLISVRSFLSVYLQKIKNEYESVVYTKTVTRNVNKIVKKKIFFGLYTIEEHITVPEVETISYKKHIKGINLQINSICDFDHENKQVCCSINGYQTIEEFINSIKKTDRYKIMLKIKSFKHFIKNDILIGILNFTCIKILKQDDLPPPYSLE